LGADGAGSSAVAAPPHLLNAGTSGTRNGEPPPGRGCVAIAVPAMTSAKKAPNTTGTRPLRILRRETDELGM
jgi:hypothetical protein